MKRYRSTAPEPRDFPTLDPPVTLAPGEVVELPDDVTVLDVESVPVRTPVTAGTALRRDLYPDEPAAAEAAPVPEGA